MYRILHAVGAYDKNDLKPPIEQVSHNQLGSDSSGRIYDHTAQKINTIETCRDMLSGMLDL